MADDGSMDQLTEILAESSVTGSVGSFGEHPRFSQYKNVHRAEESQKKRRSEFLERQKEARFDHANHARKLAMNEFDAEDDLKDVNMDDTKADLGDSDGTKRKAKPKKWRKPNRYADELMTSEWLVDIPETLSSEWVCVPCPVGRRCLVVASGGVTTAYSKSGYLLKQFSSYLPGGCLSSHGHGRFTLVDCVLEQSSSTFYCLDVIAWNGLSIAESDFDCRHFMLSSRISENINFGERSKQFPYAFVCLSYCRCEKHLIEEMLKSDFGFTLDGLLFYYCPSPYVHGQSPLVGWLKAWMLPEILSVSVPAHLMEGNTTSSGETQKFIDQFNKEHKHKPTKVSMDASES